MNFNKTRFNWLTNKYQYSLYELIVNWLIMLIPIFMIFVLIIWVPIQESDMSRYRTNWIDTWNNLVASIKTESFKTALQNHLVNDLKYAPEVANQILDKFVLVSNHYEVPTYALIQNFIFEVLFKADEKTEVITASNLLDWILEQTPYKTQFTKVSEEVRIYSNIFVYFDFNSFLEACLKYYPAYTTLFMCLLALGLIYSLKKHQRKLRIKKPWKYRPFIVDIQKIKTFRKNGNRSTSRF